MKTMSLRHYLAPNDGGTEILSVCPKHIRDLGPVCVEVPPELTFPHAGCDLCEMLDQGRLPYRLSDLHAKDIVLENARVRQEAQQECHEQAED